jgi:hypothetical protein
VQKYTIEADRRIRYEKLLLGDTVASWPERISRQTREEWHCLVRHGERVDEATPMTWDPEPASVRQGMCIDGDWREGMPKPRYGPAPPPPPPPKRILMEVPDLSDEQLEAREDCLRFRVWKGEDGVTFWIPTAEVTDWEMKFTRAVANRFSVAKEYWWLTNRDGTPIDKSLGIAHGDEYEWRESTEESLMTDTEYTTRGNMSWKKRQFGTGRH